MRDGIFIDLPFPMKGLDESSAYSNQPPQTSRDILNMRPDNPANGRVQGAQRSGLSKFTDPSSTINGPVKIQHGTSLTYDSRNVTYSAATLTTNTSKWSNLAYPNWGSRGVKLGQQSDVYALAGPAAVVKYNRDGEELWRCTLPIQDPLHICRALCLDDQDNVYVGVSEGGDQKKARIFKIVQDLENTTHVDDVSTEGGENFGAWVIEPGGFIEDMFVFSDQLYTFQNFPDRWGSKCVRYSSIGTAVPQPSLEHMIPYPVNSAAIKKNGDYATSHEPFTGRSQGDPRFPFNSPVLVDWTPDLLRNYQDRVWARFSPDDLDLEEDEEVFVWLDQSGNDRHLYKHASKSAPRFNRVGIAGRPSVRFSGNTAGVNQFGQALQSQPNTSTARDYADQQKTILPSYTGSTDAEKAMFALVIVFRPTVDTTVRWIMGQSNNLAAYPAAGEWQMQINRDDGDAVVALAGAVHVYDSVASGGGGTNGRPTHAVISTASIQAAVVSVLHDGGRTTTNPKSIFRLNGTGADRWDSNARSTLLPTEIGHVGFAVDVPTASNVGDFQGEITDILVLRDTTIPQIGDGLISHPYSPDAGGSAAGTGVGADPVGTNGDSDLERIEGWAAWKNGLAHLLPGGHPFSRLKGPPRAGGIAEESKQLLLCSENGIVAKWGASKGDLKWVVTARIAQSPFPAVAVSGIGYGIATDEDGNFYTTGPTIVAPADASVRDNAVMRKIIDNGDSATISAATVTNNSPTTSHATSAWSKTSIDITGDATIQSWTYKYPRLCCDTFSNIYVPWHEMATVSGRSVTIWDKTGLYHLSGAFSVPTGGVDGYAVAVDPKVPEYEDDFAGGSVAETPRAEFFYQGTDNSTDSVHAVRFSEATVGTGASRTTVNLAVSGGAIKRFTSAGVSSMAGAGTLAEPQLVSTSQFIGSANVNSETFFIDGKQLRVFNPRDDTVLEWKSKTAGSIPTDAKLICRYRSRIVLARFASNPNGWFMTAFSDPYDADTAPPVDGGIPTQSIAGAGAQAGDPGDIITALMPYSDDLLFVGCDHTILRMTGDPMAGGQFDVISDNIGVAFGPSWCKAPDGQLYFFGSRGGVFKMSPSGPPIPLSDGPLPREMSEIDFSTYQVQLAWNDEDNGFHVFVEPLGAGGVLVRHWFWSASTGGWFPDEIGLATSTGVQPTYAWTVDGDEPEDRTLLLGCEDGYVRRWDGAATSDDGVVIESRVMLGPFSARQGMQARFKKLDVALADNLDGCRYEMAASQNADTPGLPVCQGPLTPGQNFTNAVACGNFVWLLLRNAQFATTWAFEKACVMAYAAGRARERLRG